MVRRNESDVTAVMPTEAELEILNVVWSAGPSTVREVHSALVARGVGYTTVLKQMQVMTEKGLLTRSERYRSHVYEAGTEKGEVQKLLARNLLQRAFDGSAKNLVLGALSLQPVSAAELSEIRQMLDAFEKGAL